MALIKLKPTSPGRRAVVRVVNPDLHKGKPHAPLLEKKTRTAGRHQHRAQGKRLAVIDFQKRPLPVGPPPEHKIEREKVLQEMQEAGWTLAEEKTFLPYQYFLLFSPGR